MYEMHKIMQTKIVHQSILLITLLFSECYHIQNMGLVIILVHIESLILPLMSSLKQRNFLENSDISILIHKVVRKLMLKSTTLTGVGVQ
jgi:hypothetical protein